MVWKAMSVKEVASSLGLSISEVREKQHLMHLIIKARAAKGLSQAALAKKVGVTQARIAQIESGVGTARVTFDVLFNILAVLGYQFHIVTKKAA